MDLLIFNLMTNILDTSLVFYYIVVALSKKDIDKKRVTKLLPILIIINTMINTYLGLANFAVFLIILTVSTIFYSYMLKESLAYLIMHSLSATILMGVIEVISVAFICLAFNILPSTLLELNIYRVLAVLLSKITMFLSIKYIVKNIRLSQFTTLKFNISLVLIFLFDLYIIFMTYTVYKYLRNHTLVEYLNLIGLGLGTILFNWIIYKITKESIYRSQQEIIWKMKEEEYYKKNFYVSNINDMLQTIRSQRHELNNYLTTLYGLIYLGNYDEAKEYIRRINDRLSFMNNIVETNNPVISAIMSVQKNKAFQEGIDMEIDIDDMPEELPFDTVDLSIIIGNLLNNAMEACISLGKDKPRKIQFYMGIEEEELKIDIKNSKCNQIRLDSKEFLTRFTTKEDKENHGFGLRNVNLIVEQYKGKLHLEDLGDEFRAYVILPIKNEFASDLEATSYI